MKSLPSKLPPLVRRLQVPVRPFVAHHLWNEIVSAIKRKADGIDNCPAELNIIQIDSVFNEPTPVMCQDIAYSRRGSGEARERASRRCGYERSVVADSRVPETCHLPTYQSLRNGRNHKTTEWPYETPKRILVRPHNFP